MRENESHAKILWPHERVFFGYRSDSGKFGNFQFLQSRKAAKFYSKIFIKLHANNIRFGDPVVYRPPKIMAHENASLENIWT